MSDSAYTSRTIDRPIRVCFVIDNLSVAGTESQLLALIRSLDRLTVMPYLCLLDGTGEQSKSLEPDNCPTLRIGVRSLRHPLTLVRTWQFARFLRRERIDVLQASFPDSTYFAVPVARLARVPCVVRTRRNLGYWMKPIDRWLGRVYNRMTNATVANCEACRQAVIADEGASPGSVAVIPNGVDLARFVELPEPATTNGDAGPQRVGIVANLRPVKNLDLFVSAAKLLATSHPHVRFQIAGEGELRPELDRIIEESGLQTQVELLGAVSDVPAFLGSLDVAVLCSRSEGLPNAILEYMAAARPIVATAVGGTGELIENEQHGLLVPPESAEQLAASIERLLLDRVLASRLGKNARQRALANYSLEAQARHFETFYRGLLEGKNGRTVNGGKIVAKPDESRQSG